MGGELLVSLDEAARRLGLCRRSVQGLIYAGQLPSVRIGRSRRVSVVDLEGFVERLRQEDDHEVEPLAVVGGGQSRGLVRTA
jgi:excisionase family DNA binding protein